MTFAWFDARENNPMHRRNRKTGEHLMMGSDAPFPPGEPDPVKFVRSALPAEQADTLMHKNFDRLLGA